MPHNLNWKQEDLQAVGRLKEKRSGVQSHPQLPETQLKQKQTKQDISKEYNVIPHQQSKRKKLTAIPQGGCTQARPVGKGCLQSMLVTTDFLFPDITK